MQKFNAQPPLEIYKKSKCNDISEGQMEAAIEERTEFPESGGIYTYFQGMPYPRKGWPTVEATEAINIVKKITLFTFRNWFLLLSKKNVEQYISLVDYVLDNPFKLYLLKHGTYYNERYYCKFTKEFRKFLEILFGQLNIDLKLAEIFAMIVELDDAYRYRLQDLFSETHQQLLLKQPIKEVSRLIRLGLERDDHNITDKTKVFSSLFGKLLYLPKIYG